MNLMPEQRASLDIDVALVAAGWILQNREDSNLAAGRGSYNQHNTVVHKEVGLYCGPPTGDGAGGSRRAAERGAHPRRDPQRGGADVLPGGERHLQGGDRFPQRHPRLQTGAGVGAGGEGGGGCRSGGESLIQVSKIASFLMTLQRWLSAGQSYPSVRARLR